MVLNLILSLGSIVEPSLYMDVVLFSSRSASARERVWNARTRAESEKEKNKCLISPPPCQLLIIISSAFAVPIKLDQWYRRYNKKIANCLCNSLNPFSANSDQQQFSPNNILHCQEIKLWELIKMITIEKMLWSFIKFSQLIVKGDVWRSVWRISMWILGLKGLSILQHLNDTQSRVFVEECLLRLLQCWKRRLKDVRPSDYCRILSHSHKATENLFTESVRQGVTKRNLACNLRDLGFTISQTTKTEK